MSCRDAWTRYDGEHEPLDDSPDVLRSLVDRHAQRTALGAPLDAVPHQRIRLREHRRLLDRTRHHSHRDGWVSDSELEPSTRLSLSRPFSCSGNAWSSRTRWKRELGYAPKISRHVGVARMRATASSKLVPRGSTRASVAVLTLLALTFAAAALMTTLRAFAAPPGDPTGPWQLYDDKTGKPSGVVRLYIEGGTLRGRIERLRPGTSPKDKCTKCPPPQKDKPLLGLFVAWALVCLRIPGPEWSGIRSTSSPSEAR